MAKIPLRKTRGTVSGLHQQQSSNDQILGLLHGLLRGSFVCSKPLHLDLLIRVASAGWCSYCLSSQLAHPLNRSIAVSAGTCDLTASLYGWARIERVWSPNSLLRAPWADFAPGPCNSTGGPPGRWPRGQVSGTGACSCTRGNFPSPRIDFVQDRKQAALLEICNNGRLSTTQSNP